MAIPNYPLIVNQDGSTHWTGVKGRVGCTLNPPKGSPGYPESKALSMPNALVLAKILGYPAANSAQKFYFQAGGTPDQFAQSMPTNLPPVIAAFIAQGGFITLSVKPPKTFSQEGDTAFVAFVDACQSQLGPGGYQVVLWQEPNTNKSVERLDLGPVRGDKPFASAQYATYMQHYSSLFAAAAPGVPLGIDLALCGTADACNLDSVLSFLQAVIGVGVIPAFVWLDYYLTATRHGTPVIPSLLQVGALIDPLGIPLGLGEFNYAASPSTFVRDYWESYCDDIANHFSDRTASGYDNSDLMIWFGQNAAVGNPDQIIAGDEKVVGFQRIINRCAA